MFKKLALENFKAFGDRQEMPLAPITLIYGPNSAGKSSIIQSLLWMKQTCDPSLNESDRLIFRGNLVDLGSFNSIVHKHDSNARIGIEMTVSSNAYMLPSLPWTKISGVDMLLGLHLQKLQGDGSRVRSELSEVLIGKTGGISSEVELPTLLPTRFKRASKPSSSTSNVFERKDFVLADAESTKNLKDYVQKTLAYLSKQAELTGPANRASEFAEWLSDLASVRSGSPRNLLLAIRKEAAHLKDFSVSMWQSQRKFLPQISLGNAREDGSELPGGVVESMISRELRDVLQSTMTELAWITYLGPLRHPPERHYILSGSGSRSVGKTGEFTAEVLHSSSRRFREELNRWFVDLDIPYEIQLQTYGDDVSGELVLMTLKDRNSKILVSPTDVGFGVGQILPILVEGIAFPGSVICVEQPEIHLHPRLQGNLADFFIETIAPGRTAERATPRRNSTAWRSRRGEGNQWIVETHSEALMLRLRRRVREGKISPDMISVLYVAPGVSGGAVVKQIGLNREGDFVDEWPGGFFEERFDEML